MLNFNIILPFLLILIVFQLTGDLFFIVNKKFNRKSPNQFTILEQGTYSLIFGMLLNSFFTLFEVYLIPFKLWILLLFNLILILIGFLWNSHSFSGFTLYRIIKSMKSKNQESKKLLLKIAIFLLGIFVLFWSFLRIHEMNEYYYNCDIFAYMHSALDSIRNGWNFTDPKFLGIFYSTRLFSFFLIPFISIDPNQWYLIITNYLAVLQFILFFLLILNISLRYRNKVVFSIFLILMFLAGIYLPSWFYLVLPSNWALILIIPTSQFLFNKEQKSSILFVVSIIIALVLHFSTVFLMITLPIVITYLIRLKYSPDSSGVYKILRKIQKKWKNYGKSIKIVFSTLIFILILFMVYLLIPIIRTYLNFNREVESITLTSWNLYSIGIIPVFILLSLASIIFIKQLKTQQLDLQFVFYFIFSLFLTIYLINVKFWNIFIHSGYLPYRFFVYLNFSFILLSTAVFSPNSKYFSYIQEYFHFIYNKISKSMQVKFKMIPDILKMKISHIFNRINNFFHSSISPLKTLLILFLSLSFIPQIYTNYQEDFFYYQYSNYWPEGYVDALNFINEVKSENSTYLYNDGSIISTANWKLFHTYLGDTRCIDLDDSYEHIKDSQYANYSCQILGVDSAILQKYDEFKDYIFNQTKQIYSYGANYKNLNESQKTTQEVDYIILDSLSNMDLLKLILMDSSSFEILFETQYFHFRQLYTVYVFRPTENPQPLNYKESEYGWETWGDLIFNDFLFNQSNVFEFQTTDIQISKYGNNLNLKKIEWNFSIMIPNTNITRSIETRNDQGPVWKIVFNTDGKIEFHNHLGIEHTNTTYQTMKFINFTIKWEKNLTQRLYLNDDKISEIVAADTDIDYIRLVNEGPGITYFIFSSDF